MLNFCHCWTPGDGGQLTSSCLGSLLGPWSELGRTLLDFFKMASWALYSLTWIFNKCSSLRSSLISVIRVTFSCRDHSHYQNTVHSAKLCYARPSQIPISSYLHDLDVDLLMLLSRFGQPHLETVDGLLQVISLVAKCLLNIIISSAFLHLKDTTYV